MSCTPSRRNHWHDHHQSSNKGLKKKIERKLCAVGRPGSPGAKRWSVPGNYTGCVRSTVPSGRFETDHVLVRCSCCRKRSFFAVLVAQDTLSDGSKSARNSSVLLHATPNSFDAVIRMPRKSTSQAAVLTKMQPTLHATR